MAKIKDVARITPLRKVTVMSTPTITNATRTRGNANNPGFKQWIADRHTDQLNLQDIILVALEELQEPVSVLEMQHYLKAEASIDLIDYRIKYALDQLVAAGKAASHIETKEERTIRANGVPVTPKPAYLFNSGRVARVRKTAVIVDGYSIFDPRTMAGKPKPRKIKVTTTAEAPVPTPSLTSTVQTVPSNAAIDYLIEKLVADRTRDLQKQLDEANAKLEQFRKLLS